MTRKSAKEWQWGVIFFLCVKLHHTLLMTSNKTSSTVVLDSSTVQMKQFIIIEYELFLALNVHKLNLNIIIIKCSVGWHEWLRPSTDLSLWRFHQLCDFPSCHFINFYLSFPLPLLLFIFHVAMMCSSSPFLMHIQWMLIIFFIRLQFLFFSLLCEFLYVSSHMLKTL